MQGYASGRIIGDVSIIDDYGHRILISDLGALLVKFVDDPIVEIDGIDELLTEDTFKLRVPEPFANITAVRSIASLTTPQIFLQPNVTRKMVSIYNTGTGNLFVKMGLGVTTTNFTVRINTVSYFEFPLPIYIGIVEGVWSAANGVALITEYS